MTGLMLKLRKTMKTERLMGVACLDLFGSSDFCEQLLVALIFILPVAITSGESTLGTPATNVDPTHVFAVIVEGNTRCHFEIFRTARTLTLFERCVSKIIGTVTNWMALLARATLPNGCTFCIVNQKLEAAMPTRADGVREVRSWVSIPIRVVSDLYANVDL